MDREQIAAPGEVQGEAWMLLKFLAARKLPVDEKVRARILVCMGTAVLERWAEQALTASTIDAVFKS